MSLRRQITNDEEVSKTLKNSSTMTLLALKGWSGKVNQLSCYSIAQPFLPTRWQHHHMDPQYG